MKYPLIYYGHPLLRKKCAQVVLPNKKLKEIIENMRETMLFEKGIGLAAPQAGLDMALFVLYVPEDTEEDEEIQEPLFRYFINPKILYTSAETDWMKEGCLSIPKVRVDVERPIAVKAEATDLEGNLFQVELKGLEARCFLHENDHINGVLMIDRADNKTKMLIKPKLQEIKNQYN